MQTLKDETIFPDNLHQGWSYQSFDAGDELPNLIAASITKSHSSTTIMNKKNAQFLPLFFLFCSKKILGKNSGRKRESERKFEFETWKGKAKLGGKWKRAEARVVKMLFERGEARVLNELILKNGSKPIFRGFTIFGR